MSEISAEETAKQHLGMVDQQVKALLKVQKALKILADANALESPQKVTAACKLLETFDPNAFGLDVDFGALLSLTIEDQKQRAGKRRIEFGRNIKEMAAQKNVSCQMITTDPMTFSLPPFTVSINLEKNLATIHYARLAIEELPAKPEKIMAALQKNMQRLDTGWSGEGFFDALYAAYEFEVFKRGGHPGDRITLVNLLAFVALSFQNLKFRQDPVAGHYRAYGRVRMAYDLAGLRRSGLLERNGRRLNLGTATGAATRNKKDVLFVEEGEDRGQYYLSIWFSTTPKENRP